jgi:uncharacterized protein YmfQ (DUF2313 family)
MNAEAYTRQVLQLFPDGLAWSGEVLRQFAQAVADELARIDARGANLIDERDPRTTTELLPEWETETGLPDPCVADWDALTLDQRRGAVVGRVVSQNEESRPFYIELAAALGHAISITEYLPFQVGRSCVGESLSNGAWQYAWTVNNLDAAYSFRFRSGYGRSGMPLATWRNDDLECALAAKAPAHTVLLFNYPL